MKNLFLSNFTRKYVSLLLFSVLFTALPLAAQVAEPYVLPGFAPVQYATGVTEITSAADLNSLPTPGRLTTGWYVLEGTFTYNGTITVSGDVNLILRDGCNVTVNGANAGIDVEGSNSLTIFGQTGSGVLTVHGSGGGAGIGGSGNSGGVGKAGGIIIINGGEIHAFGGAGGAGIGGGGGSDGGGVGGTITINGGIVEADGSGIPGGGGAGTGGAGGGAGIGGGGGTLTGPHTNTCFGGNGGTIIINGGAITALGGNEDSNAGGAGIGGGGGTTGGDGGTIIITTSSGNGSITATGGYGKGAGAGIGGGGGMNSLTGDGAHGGYSGSISIVHELLPNATGGHETGSSNFSGADVGGGGCGNNTRGSQYINQYDPGNPNVHTITITQTSNGSIVAVPGGKVSAVSVLNNSSQTFYFVPDAGYKVDNVEVDGGSIGHPSTYTFTDVQGDHSITATFSPVVSPAVITTVNTNVTAPATGGIPNTTATNGADFVAGTVTWTPGDNPFLANTAYTATVTLTAIGSTFAATLTTATINGQAATVTNNTGNEVTLSYTFPPTAPTPPIPPIPPNPPVSKIAPSMSLTATPGATVDDDITLTAKVSGAAGDPIPTGKVTFKQGDVELGTADLNSGVAIFVCSSPFYAGNYSYTANYPGDANFYANTANATVEEPVSFYVSDNYLNFIAAGETKPIVVISNAGWSLAADAAWATITSANDGSHTMFVTAKPNPAVGQRTMLFTFRAGSIMKTLRATQDGLNATAIRSVDVSSAIVYLQDGNAIVKSDTPVQRVVVYDVLGKLLKEVKGESNLVTISGLPKQQVLIVRVTSDKGQITSYKLRVE